MRLTKSSDQATVHAPTENFTGTAYLDPIRTADDQSAIGCAHVRFMPGTRTNWHRHPHGQTLYVTDGIGFVCSRGGRPQLIQAGDSVYIEPNEEHWHGAAFDHYMAHVAIQESDGDDSPVIWLEPVTDEEYRSV